MQHALFAGLSTIDIQYFVDQFPHANQKLKCPSPKILVGGPSLNAAAAYAFLAGSAPLVTAIGQNAFHDYFISDFKACNIDLIDVIAGKSVEPVLASVITSSNGDRAILSHHPDDHQPEVDVQVVLDRTNPGLVMIDGFYPTISKQLCREAGRRGIPVVFDGGSWKDHLDELIPFISIAICSADFKPPGCHDEKDVASFWKERGVEQVIISRGEQPLLVWDNERHYEIPVNATKIVDSLGAGDFLHGAFCYYFLRNRDLESSLRQASHFATCTCEYPGTRECFSKLTIHSNSYPFIS